MHIEPFGYFRAEPFGWTDCKKDDEGAMPLFDGAVIMDLQKQLATERASMFAESQRKQQLEQQRDELLEALESIIDLHDSASRGKQVAETIGKARAVIQKVRGGE